MSAVHHELPSVSALMEANRRHLANVLALRAASAAAVLGAVVLIVI